MNSLTEGLFWLYLTQRYKLSVFEMKHAANILGLDVTAAMMYPLPQVAIKLALLSGPHVLRSSKAIHRCSYKLHHWFRVYLSVYRFSLWLYSINHLSLQCLTIFLSMSYGQMEYMILEGSISILYWVQSVFWPCWCHFCVPRLFAWWQTCIYTLRMKFFFTSLNSLDCIHSHIT